MNFINYNIEKKLKVIAVRFTTHPSWALFVKKKERDKIKFNIYLRQSY